jgi:copper transport protein
MALSVGVVLATGLYSAAREVASVDGFLTTTYGHVLIIKTGIVVAAGALGAANFLILRGLSRRHRAGERRVAGFRSVVLAEILAGVGIFLAASILASSVPARGPEFAAPRPARVITQSVPSGDLFVTVSMRPTRAGNNSVTVFAGSTRRPPPAPIETVSLDLRQGGTTKAIALAPVEQGRYVGLANVPSPGSWNLVVAVERGGKEIVLPASTWSLGPSDPARAVRYSARSVAPALDALAGLLLGLTLLGGLWLLAGRPGLGAPRPTSAAATGDRAP